MDFLSPEQIQDLLRKYHDIPVMIEQLNKNIHSLQDDDIFTALHSPVISGMPSGKGTHSDPTAINGINRAQLGNAYTKRLVKERKQLIEQRNWMAVSLTYLDRVDRRILELAYMGPEDPQERMKWNRRAPWKIIAQEIDYSESQTFERARVAIKTLSDLSVQEVIQGFSGEKPE